MEQRKKQNIKMVVFGTLKKICNSKMWGDEFLEPIIRFLNIKPSSLEEVYDDLGCIIPFLVWVNKQAGLEESEIFNVIFHRASVNHGFISSEEATGALKTLKDELPFTAERRLIDSILSKKPLPRLKECRPNNDVSLFDQKCFDFPPSD